MKHLIAATLCAALCATSVQAGGAAPPPTSGGGNDGDKIIIGTIILGVILSIVTGAGAPTTRSTRGAQPGVDVDENGGANAGFLWKF